MAKKKPIKRLKTTLKDEMLNMAKGVYVRTAQNKTFKHGMYYTRFYRIYRGIVKRYLTEWSKIYKIPYKILANRIYKGWPPEKVFTYGKLA